MEYPGFSFFAFPFRKSVPEMAEGFGILYTFLAN